MSPQKGSIDMKSLQAILELTGRFRRYVFISLLMMTLEGIIEIGNIFSIAPIIDVFIHTKTEDMSIITRKFMAWISYTGFAPDNVAFIVIFLSLSILKGVITIIVKYTIISSRYELNRQLLNELYTSIFKTRWHFFASSHTGMLLNTLLRELNNIGGVIFSIGTLGSTIIRIMFFLALPIYISWKVTLIALFSGISFAVPIFFLGKVNYSLGKKITLNYNNLSQILQESLVAAKVILGFGNQHKNVGEIDRVFNNYSKAAVLSQLMHIGTPEMFYPLVMGAIIFTTYISLNHFSLPIAEVLIMAYAFMKMLPLIGNVTREKNALSNSLPSYEQAKNILNLAAQNIQKTGSILFHELTGGLELKNIDFSYPGGEIVLKGLNAAIGKGKLTAFVGGSGAGKSTIVDIMIGFYEPDKGVVAVDGVALFDYDMTSFRQRLGYVPQDSILFNDTIRGNLLWGKDDATEEEIVEACKLANAHDFILELQNGYDTVVGERGIRMSGGQRQRIALARALLRKPQLLILDEATSSLDSQSELLIQQAVEKIAHKMTIVVIAHRLSTVRAADWIYVLDSGRVVDEGSFDDLISRDGLFKNMAGLQGLVFEKNGKTV
jgi:ATP-binding cassette subfamily B protein